MPPGMMLIPSTDSIILTKSEEKEVETTLKAMIRHIHANGGETIFSENRRICLINQVKTENQHPRDIYFKMKYFLDLVL